MEQENEFLPELVVELEHNPALNKKLKDKFDYKGVELITFAHALHDTYASWLAALLPLLIEKFSLTNTMAGALSMVYTLPSVLQPAIGYLADRKNLRWLIVLAPAITSLVMSSLGIIPSYALLVPLLLIAGLSSSGLHSVGPGVTSHFSGKRIGKGMSFWMIGGELGYSLGPLLVMTIVGVIGLRRLPLMAIGGLLVSVFLFFATRNVDTRGENKTPKVNKTAFLSGIKMVMVPMALLLITRALMSVMLSTFMPTFLRSQGASLIFAGAGMAVAGSAGAVGSYIAGSLSDKIGRRKILFASIILTPICMLLFLNTQGWVKIPMLILCGFFGLSLLPVMIATIMEFFPEDRSFANGIFMALNFIIQALAAVVAGRIADAKGMAFTFMVAALALPFGLLALLMMPKDKKINADEQEL
ncbi:MAG: MFS transporter [Anaerolineaceae bacterium]|nr:MFS transporter [Anaerolineaceae bacterium]